MGAALAGQAVPGTSARGRGEGWRVDPWLIGAALSLLGLGLVMIASASVSIADRQVGEPLYYFLRQATFAAVGLFAAWLAAHVALRVWHRASGFLLIAGLVLLALVLIPGVGREVNGSMRWLALGPVNVQPSELMKLFMILYLSGYLVRRGEEVRSLVRGFIKPVGVLAVIALLLLLEPDYGTTVVLFATALGMLFLGGVPLRTFLAWVLVISGFLGAIVWTAPYRMERLMVFLNPWADPTGSGYQLTQALIAVGRGEWWGVGLGASVQKLFYLPEAHTDFLFAVLAEELGFAGAAAVIALFGFLVWRAFSIARRAEERELWYGAYLAYGIGLHMGLQAFINIGVNLGVLPTKGLTLPLMSYGGSSLVVNCVALGLLVRVDYELRNPK